MSKSGVLNVSRMGLLVIAACAIGITNKALAGADNCTTAPVTSVPVGPPGMPVTTTINSDNTLATGPDPNCLPSGDVGWWEPFEILEHANITIDHCGTNPNQRPNWGFIRTGCGCSAGQYNVDFANRTKCGDFNVSLTYLGLPPGIYYYPVYTIPGDKRCGNTGATCSSDLNCTGGFPCTDNLHPYTMHITAEAPVGGCCHPNTATCDDDVLATSCTGPDDRWVAGTLCADINCIPFNDGPDLIVGNVWNCAELGRQGSAGAGTIGMSCWTTACTIGDEGTDWYGLPSVNHPMISVNLFRLRNEGGADRLMQLGQSWLKHGFGTENADDCALGCDPSQGHFNLNAPGCSDTYAASQFVACDLGPRSMLNPYTGVMPAGDYFNPIVGCSPVQGRESMSHPANDHRNHVHNAISHRLQIKDVDLIPSMNPGATYFSEGQYLLPHEFVAANGTQNNNVSYKQVGVACSGTCGVAPYSFTDLTSTFTEQPAINAWPGASQSLIEPEPMVDGRGFLVYKVTDLGGVWRYEYALYNMNMDRAMRSLSIPLPENAGISNAGFYAPLNHATEPDPTTQNYDNNPWVFSTSGGSISWTTDDFGTDPLANAVRYGTMYNFWFDANTPPQLTSANVGLFKTGGSVVVATVGPTSGEPAPAIVWDGDPSSSNRTTRTLVFSVDPPVAATGGGTSAIRITSVDLEHPLPAYQPTANPLPKNFSAWDTNSNGTCTNGDHMDHHCDTSADCRLCGGVGANTNRPCASDADCPGGFCPTSVCTGDARRPCSVNGNCTGFGTCGAPITFACGALAACTGEAAMSPTGVGGCGRWVGKPERFRERQEVVFSPPDYLGARLQCTPYYHDWVTATATETVAVFGGEILPNSKYSVQAYSASCKGNEGSCTNVSAPVEMLTRRHGDVVSGYNPPATTTQPDATDIGQLVAKFKSQAGSPSNSSALIQPNVPDGNSDVGASDIVQGVDAAKSFVYSFGGPCPCPSLAVCGAAPCPGGAGTCVGSGAPGLGPESTCIKLCRGGTNAGEQCNNHTHCGGGGVCDKECLGGANVGLGCSSNGDCPGSTCAVVTNNAFCRDKCQRCTPP